MQAQNSECRNVVMSKFSLALTILGRQGETNKIVFFVNAFKLVVVIQIVLF